MLVRAGEIRMRRSGCFLAVLCALGLSSLVAAPAHAAPPEMPVTKQATAIAGTTATLNGELNPTATAPEALEYQFLYRQSGAECTLGLEAPEAPVKAEGKPKEAASVNVTGLEPSKPYTFCVVAKHEAEQSSGLPVTFKTLPVPPSIDAQSASGITPFEAHLEGLVNANNQTTTCKFEYGETTGYGKEAKCEPESLEGFGDQGVGATVTGLGPKATYHYRIVAENAANEKTEHPDAEFTTLTEEPPIIASESVSGLTANAAKLEAQVNPDYLEATYSFEYAANQALTGATTVAGASPLAAGFGDQPASVEISGLQTRTTYYYRVVATNKAGTTHGPTEPTEHFQTLATPAVTTAAAQNLSRTSAALSGTVNPAGAATTYHFAYVAAAEYEPLAADPYANGRTTSESATVGSDYTVHAVGPIELRELQPGVSYHYAVVATNSEGATVGPDVTFTTAPPTPPIAVTGEAVNVTPLSATLTGGSDTRELQTALQFEFGTTPLSGSLAPATVAQGSGSLVAISTFFNNDLQPGTTYYYRAVATNSDGVSYGVERSFTTGSFPGLPAVAPVQLVAWPAFVARELAAVEPHEESLNRSGSKPVTKAQKLAKALAVCKRKAKRQRSSCRRQAKRKYR